MVEIAIIQLETLTVKQFIEEYPRDFIICEGCDNFENDLPDPKRCEKCFVTVYVGRPTKFE